MGFTVGMDFEETGRASEQVNEVKASDGESGAQSGLPDPSELKRFITERGKINE